MNSSSDVSSTAKSSLSQSKSGATLRRPVQIVKKRSGPLDDALDELDKNSRDNVSTTTTTTTTTATPAASTVTVRPQTKTTSISRPSMSSLTSPPSTRRRCSTKDKEKKRERWLLTRKTWKYMTDAGRKLIPEGAQNRKEDIPKIEAHFQQICAGEPSFILWRRKSSYPGAMRNSKKRLKQLLQHTGQKSHHIVEQEEANNADQILELLYSHLKLDEAIKTDTLLGTKTVRPDQTSSPSAQRPKPSGSGVRRSCGYGVEGSMPVSLRGPGFLPPPQAHLQQLSVVEQLLERLRVLSRSVTLHDTISLTPEKINADLLNDKTALKKIYTALKKQQLHRNLSKHSMPPKPRTNLSHSSSMLSLLHFGSSNKQSNEKSSKSPSTSVVPITIPTTSYNAVTIGGHHASNINTHPNTNTSTNSSLVCTSSNTSMPLAPTTAKSQRQRMPPSSLDLLGFSNASTIKPKPNQRRRHELVEKQTNSCGTQTNFIQLSDIKRLAEEYKEFKRVEAAAEDGGGCPTTDDEAEKQGGAGYHHRRKSSIDNEDVSQSVSDTIKRYLRMARKKSVHDDNANRFKRVNYDRNLRNIRAKGEINPPGMDEDNSKAVQTLDAWALITLDFIRGNENSGVLEAAHKEWEKALEERIQKKMEYEQKLMSQREGGMVIPHPGIHQSVSSCSSSAPTSPTTPASPLSPTMTNRNSTSSSCSTYDARPSIGHAGSGGMENVGGILHSSSQFIANLWHGTTSSSNSSSPTSVSTTTAGAVNIQQKNCPGTAAAGYSSPTPMTEGTDVNVAANNSQDMQKSKSSSHVGQFVSRKILRNRSKSQTRSDELPASSPSNTPSAATAVSKWTRTDELTWTSENGNRILLYDTTFHNLSDLESKLVQKVAMEKVSELNIGIDLSGYTEGKSQKRRILTKKKAMTTSLFDIGKKDYNSSNLSLFGTSLESCVVNDKKHESSILSASYERGSRNSIASLFRIGGGAVGGVGNGSAVDCHKLSENVRSCENLPSANANNGARSSTKIPSMSNYFGNLAKSASMQISRSQSDVRRNSQDIGSSSELNSPIRDAIDCVDVEMDKGLQVPRFVTSCISYLEDNGLHKIGIFRVSTPKKRVKQLRDDFDKNAEKTFDIDTCPHNVATLLKEFLRDLPEPLLTTALYKAFLDTQKIRNRRLQLEAISHLVKLLPPAHQDTLYVLLRFLAKVAACSDDVSNSDGSIHLTGNKMDSNNLATVFAPNILRSTINSQSSSTPAGDRSQTSCEQEFITDAINVIRIMIDHYEELFRVSAELLDVVYSQLLEESSEQLYTICDNRSNLLREAVKNYHPDTSTCTPTQVTSTKTTPFSIEDRRQSSPNVLDQSGIVSVSLEIPMQLNYGSSDESGHRTTTASGRNLAYGEIPYIEDFNSEQSLGNPLDSFQISGSLLFSTKKEPPEPEAKLRNLQLYNSDLNQHNAKLQNIRSQPSAIRSTIDVPSSKDNLSIRHSKVNEPKLPTSITNIGGATLRSKTADFERMSSKTKQSPSHSSSTIASQTAVPPAVPNAVKTSGHQHLYKRQEIISSAKRSQHK